MKFTVQVAIAITCKLVKATTSFFITAGGIALKLYADDTDGKYSTRNWISWESELEPYHVLKWTNSNYHCPAYTGRILTNPSGHYLGS